MSKVIRSFKISEENAEKLNKKAVELTIKSETIVKEPKILAYLIENVDKFIDIDKNGKLKSKK